MKHITKLLLPIIIISSTIGCGKENNERSSDLRATATAYESPKWVLLPNEAPETHRSPSSHFSEKKNRLSIKLNIGKNAADVTLQCINYQIQMEIVFQDENFNVTPLYSKKDDRWHHGFVVTFLSAPNTKIETLIATRYQLKKYIIKNIPTTHFSDKKHSSYFQGPEMSKVIIGYDDEVIKFSKNCMDKLTKYDERRPFPSI